MQQNGQTQQTRQRPGRQRDNCPDGEISFGKAAGHFHTIAVHKYLVMKQCFAVGLYVQGLLHDMSKFSPAEFVNGCRYYQNGTRSPNNGEREAKGYSFAWMHHKGRNRHHYEFWQDYRRDMMPGVYPVAPVRMPRRYVAEMLMDRIAASKTYKKEAYDQHEPLKYYLNGRGRELMDPQTAKELERMLRILDRRGEKELFRFVRDYYLKGYPM